MKKTLYLPNSIRLNKIYFKKKLTYVKLNFQSSKQILDSHQTIFFFHKKKKKNIFFSTTNGRFLPGQPNHTSFPQALWTTCSSSDDIYIIRNL